MQIHVYNPKDGSDKVLALPEHCSSALLSTDPSSLVVTTVKCALSVLLQPAWSCSQSLPPRHTTAQPQRAAGRVAASQTRAPAVCSRVLEIDSSDGSVKRTLAEVPAEHIVDGSMRFNDAKVSPGGTYVLGRMHYEGPEGGPPGRLYV